MRVNYAVLQKTLDIPPVEKIEEALLSIEGFSRIDAHTFANDAYGILVKNISAEQAHSFSQALYGQGIETDVVAQTELPALPQTKFVHRLDCTSEGLLIYDPLGRHFPLPWQHVMLVAAGCVRLTDFRRVEAEIPDREGRNLFEKFHPRRQTLADQIFDPPTRRTESKTVEEQNNHLLLEIIVSGAVMRYSARAGKFRFGYLGERLTKSLPKNYALLVQDIAAFAPHAMLNRGAFFLKQDENLFPYPSKNAFFEEITWLLWRMKQEGRI